MLGPVNVKAELLMPQELDSYYQRCYCCVLSNDIACVKRNGGQHCS